jgi:hypothetical protein
MAGRAGVNKTAPTEPKETKRRRIRNWGFAGDILKGYCKELVEVNE